MILDILVGFLHNKEKHNGTRLDLAYINPQLIASATPSDKYLQTFYRMKSAELVDFLNAKHGNSWHIWNLQEPHELSYDADNIGNSGKFVTQIPVPDHRPMPLWLLVNTAQQIRDYIVESPEHVALVHCKCGKGRTGSVIAAYLMLFNGMSYKRALAEFTEKRIRHSVVDGISIKSQQLYMQYLEQWIAKGADAALLDAATRVEIVKVVIRNPRLDYFDIKLQQLEAASDCLCRTKVEPNLASPTNSSRAPSMQSCSNYALIDNAWDIIILKNQVHVLKPVPASANFPADLWLHFVGYVYQAGLKVPITQANFAVNVLFEPDVSSASNAELATPSDTASIMCPDGSTICSFIRHWKDCEGLLGLSLRGFKAFDSIEVFWRRASASQPQEWPSVPPSIHTA